VTRGVAVVDARPAGEIRVNVTRPVTRIGFGVFSFDALEQLVGAKIADLLEPLMTGPVFRRPSESGVAIDVYPLALPAGEGATIPLGQFCEIGFANDNGPLALTVPWAGATWLRQNLGDAIVRGPEPALSLDGSARVAQAWVRLRPGMRAAFPLGAMGEVGVEAA
jgi:hypothetical protein